MKRNRSLRKKVLKDLNIKEKCCKNAILGHIVGYIIGNRNKCIDANVYVGDCFEKYNCKTSFELTDNLMDFLEKSNERNDVAHKVYVLGEDYFDSLIHSNYSEILRLEAKMASLKIHNEELKDLRYDYSKGN